ncbi:hypothetical protein [Nocardiopsis suaedae]|uniref:GerMN domain-containing protein n=1 Tax=Nocardiopsis suaedae TaxID=3018444 RepID=A0ABT4TFB8_9ACTN|nr:hypothetical protein [Nocardiopsis suaedae]MDA2803393.1 hypothetical protein [Nocardiopsis suaedae]
MSTPNEIAASARRTRTTIIVPAALVVVLAVVAAVAITTALNAGGEQLQSAASPSPTRSRAEGEPLRPPAPGHEVEGYPVNFEHTPEGAVAMTTAYVSRNATLDPADKAETRSAYAVELQGIGQEELEQLAEQLQLGIEDELDYYGFDVDLGDLPQQATYSALPVAVVYEEIDASTTEVAVLTEVNVSDGIEAESIFLEPLEVRCVWSDDVRGGDWVISSEFPEIEVPDKAEPGTEEFQSSEWAPLQGGMS